VSVSCQNVANALLVRGRLQTGSSALLLHASLAAALRAAELTGDDDALVADVAPPGTRSFTLRLRTRTRCRGRVARDNPAGVAAMQSSIPGIFGDPRVAPDASVLSPGQGARTCLLRAEQAGGGVNGGVTATDHPTPPYLRALLTPTKPPSFLLVNLLPSLLQPSVSAVLHQTTRFATAATLFAARTAAAAGTTTAGARC
jgi:hypothetical protein